MVASIRTLHHLRMGFEPQHPRGDYWIEVELIPPPRFVPVTVDFAMVSPAQRHRELIADLATESVTLGKAQVMGVTSSAPADQTGLPGDKPYMLAVANAPRFRMHQHGFVNCW